MTAFWKRALSTKKYKILCASYALRGEKRLSGRALAREFDSTENQIEMYRRYALALLRSKRRLARFEALVVQCARDVLG